MSNSASERDGGSGEEEGYSGYFVHALGRSGKVSQSGEGVPIDNLEYKAKEVN